MTIQLNDTLINFFSDIQIKFEWNNKFYIEFMNYFPLLKKGITTNNTYRKIIATYGLINKIINMNDIRNGIKSKSIIKVFRKYVLNSEYTKILEDNFDIIVYSRILEFIDGNKIINTNINDELLNESNLANSLLASIQLSLVDLEENDRLFKLIDSFNPKIISSKIFEEALKTPSIRLLVSVLNDDTEDMITAFYIDEIDFYIGYLDLYFLAISRKNIKIANILKEMIIIKNFYIKQTLIICFEDLIGSSDIPNIIYNTIIKKLIF